MLDLTDIRSELGNHYDLAPSVDLAAEMPEIYARMDRVVSPPISRFTRPTSRRSTP